MFGQEILFLLTEMQFTLMARNVFVVEFTNKSVNN